MMNQAQAQALITLAAAIKAAHNLQIDIIPRGERVAVLVSGRVAIDCRHALDSAAILALTPALCCKPSEVKVVPVNPTDAMIEAGRVDNVCGCPGPSDSGIKEIFQAMVSAAPASETKPLHGPYIVQWMGAGVWAGIPDELPAELEGSKVWLSNYPAPTITREEVETFLVDYHAEVYEAGSDSAGYDEAGRDLAKAFLSRFGEPK